MFAENVIMGILSIILISSTTTNALTFSNEKNITDVDLDVQNSHYTIRDNNVILQSLFGQIEIPIPETVQAEINAFKAENNQTKQNQKLARLSAYNNGNLNNIHSNEFADFFECNEQAQIALSAHSENYRYWEAFFKRNTIDDTIAVRYCCNLLEYVQTAQMSLSPECREQVRLQDHVMTRSEVRYTCRQYEFYNVQCFLVRWMYWWIPLIVILILIAFGFCCCCAIKSRHRNKNYIKPSDHVRQKKSLVADI
jgi:hypothetical protein